jgi:tRNA A37 methylthiotransferase MiaB
MTNPPYILDHLEEMAKILNHSRVYSFLHVPVQSGKIRLNLIFRRLNTKFCKIITENFADIRYVMQYDILKTFLTYSSNSSQLSIHLIQQKNNGVFFYFHRI